MRAILSVIGFIGIVVLVILVVQTADDLLPKSEEERQREMQEIAEASDRQAAKEAFAENFVVDEPQVHDASWPVDTTLWIGMIDDGTDRRGFAQYACERLRQEGVTDVYRVKVIDVAEAANFDELVFLGEVNCRIP